jgi:predicted O-methyltransferase YrrM
VECGVNTGIFSLAICQYLDFNRLDRDFWLFDTFAGIPESHMRDEEREARTAESALLFEDCYERARANFAPYPRAHLVRGTVPETLDTVSIERVAYLSIDMNIVNPERAAIEHFWPKLVSGGIVVVDNYGWKPYPLQRQAMDEFAARVGVGIMLLPTGQGLMFKP